MNLNDALDEAAKELTEKLWRPLHERSSCLPNMLYHYTNAAGVEGILNSGKLWATHAFYLNDPHEMTHGHTVFRRVLAAERRSAADLKLSFLEKCTENFEKQLQFEGDLPAAYCASFSEKGDDLSQYRAYSNAGAGYCLGFDAIELKRCISVIHYASGSLFEFVAMEYDEDRQKEAMRGLLSVAWKKAEKIVTAPGMKDQEAVFHRVSLACLHDAFRLCNYFKQSGFRDEAEWRIVPTPFGAPHALPVDQHMAVRESEGLFVPYLEIPAADSGDVVNSLREIYVGPKLPFEPAQLGLLKLPAFQKVEKAGVPVDIKPSATFLQ